MAFQTLFVCFLTFTAVFARMNLVCSGGLDVGFILDSSSSIGQENFQLVRDFTEGVVQGLDVGQGEDQTRISVARYNSRVDSLFFFNQIAEKDDVIQAVRDIPYYGKGTRTSQALRVFANHHLQGSSGWREGQEPTVVIVVTDGKSQNEENIDESGSILRSKSTRVIALGVGPGADESELTSIATRPASENVIFVEDFNSLSDSATIGIVLNKVCEALDDTKQCLVNNGRCSQRCVNTYTSFYCECRSGYTLGQDGRTCSDVNECATDNGGCAQTCTNTEGSFECSCREGFILAQNGRACDTQ